VSIVETPFYRSELEPEDLPSCQFHQNKRASVFCFFVFLTTVFKEHVGVSLVLCETRTVYIICGTEADLKHSCVTFSCSGLYICITL